VGIPAAAASPDAVTGFVAGLGAGGIAALRADLVHSWRMRAAAEVIMTLFDFLLVRVSDAALVIAPALPFTCLGLADHVAELRARRGDAR
jgi:hypothetical protein